MFQSLARTQARHFAGNRRSFVSTVLLTRNWENHTVNDLRQEARKRGLTQSGNKATLITRLQQDDDHKARAHVPPRSTAPQVRHASTAEVPGVPSNPVEHIPAELKGFANIRLPDLTKPDIQPSVQIPFVPDLWDSSRIKASSAPKVPEETPIPKMIAVAGRATHHGGGPTHNLYTEPFRDDKAEARSQAPGASIWADVADDLGLPTTLKIGSVTPQHPGAIYDLAEATQTSGAQDHTHSRTLDRDERRGVYVLLGLLAGSWIAAGYFTGRATFWTKVEEEIEKQAVEQVKSKH